MKQVFSMLFPCVLRFFINILFKNNCIVVFIVGFENNFKKDGELYPNAETGYFGVPYNYDSIMHYGKTYFSRNGQNTIDVKVKTITLLPTKTNILIIVECNVQETKKKSEAVVGLFIFLNYIFFPYFVKNRKILK